MRTFFTFAWAKAQREAGLRRCQAVACADQVGARQVRHGRGRPGRFTFSNLHAEQAARLQAQVQPLQCNGTNESSASRR